MKDLYYILGTHNKATPAELNAAYGKLAEKLQPRGLEQDHFLDDHFREITQAYELLSDPKRRRMYDMALKNSQQRQLDRFKLSYLNVAATLTLIAFTSLFGYYVLKAINGTKTAKVVKHPEVVTVPVAPKHHKRKHGISPAIKNIPQQFNKTESQQVWVKVDTATAKPVKSVPMLTPPVKTVPVVVTAPPSVVKHLPALASPAAVPDKPAQGYTASIQSNVTGLVYLHQEPNYTSAFLSKIPNRAQVRVLAKGQNFCKISFNDQTGYVPNWSIPAP